MRKWSSCQLFVGSVSSSNPLTCLPSTFCPSTSSLSMSHISMFCLILFWTFRVLPHFCSIPPIRALLVRVLLLHVHMSVFCLFTLFPPRSVYPGSVHPCTFNSCSTHFCSAPPVLRRVNPLTRPIHGLPRYSSSRPLYIINLTRNIPIDPAKIIFPLRQLIDK